MRLEYAVGFICGETCSSWFVDGLVRLVATENPPVLQLIAGPVLHRSRNQLADMFLKAPWASGDVADKLVMIDSDIAFTVADVRALLAHDEPIVTGVYPNSKGKTMKIGAGFMSIRREVLKKLGPHPFNPVTWGDGAMTGEDVGFLMHAKDAGYDIVVDPNISVGHAKVQVLRIFEAGERPVEFLTFDKGLPVQ